MGRSILSGLVAGAVFSVFALAATSLMLPLPGRSAETAASAGHATGLALEPVIEPAPAAQEAPAGVAPAAADTLPKITEAAPAVVAPVAAEPPSAVAAPAAPAAPAVVPQAIVPEVPAQNSAPLIVAVPAGSEFARPPGDVLATLPAADTAPPQANAPAAPLAAAEPPPALSGTDAGAPPAAPSGPAAPVALAGEATRLVLPRAEQPLPVPPPGEAKAPEMPSALAAPDLPATPDVLAAPAAPGHALAAPAADAAPVRVSDAAPAVEVPPIAAQPDIILVPDDMPSPPAVRPPPKTGFGNAAAAPGFANVPGVAVNRLPTIGAPSEPAPVPAATEAVDPATRPLRAFGAAFSPSGAPMLSVVLLDPGPEVDIAALRGLGLPMTIAIDPMRAGAEVAAKNYRAAGFEVAILASRLPAGATPADLEVALAAWRRVLPEAVALIEPPEPVLQGNRIVAQQLVAVLAREGLGLATQSGKGLNAAEQLAATAGVPQALVWRVLDADGDMAPAIRRYLDRAAFEAMRGLGVAVMLHARPESLAALSTWQKGREGGPELAPLSALMLAGGAL